jgi:hypothetical protein
VSYNELAEQSAVYALRIMELGKRLAEARAALLAVDGWPELDADGALTQVWGTGGLHGGWRREHAATLKAAREDS